jgi:hypothetical protein
LINNPLYPQLTTQCNPWFLILNNNGLVTGLLSLELMKEEALFTNFFKKNFDK